MTSGTVGVLGVPVHMVNKRELVDQALAWSKAAEQRTILYVNAHCLNVLADQPGDQAIFNQADLIYADGISVVWAARLLAGKKLNKITGRDWIHDLSAEVCRQGLRVYILAGRPGIAVQAAANLQKQYPGLQIAGCADGYFAEKPTSEVLAEINQARAQIVLVGMGTPAQERWIAEHRAAIQAPVCWAVGALFDYVAGAEPVVPAWMERLALEWLWRLLIDPPGKWKRYILGNPRFLLRVLHQKITA